MDLPPELVDQFARGDGALFVGAGLSVGAGLPGWAALIRPLADAVGYRLPAEGALITADHLLTAAGHYANQRGLNALIRYLNDTLDTRPPPTAVHHLVAALPVNAIFTTNYDDLIERALTDAGQRRNVIVGEEELAFWSEDSVQVVKLCGSLGRPQSLVITKSQFNTYAAEHPRLVERLRTTLESKTAFFLGYSLQDPFFNQIWDNIGLNFGDLRRFGYAVLFDAEPLEADDLKRRGIHVINLQTQGRDHTALLAEWLEALKAEVDRGNPDRVGGRVPAGPATESSRRPSPLNDSVVAVLDANDYIVGTGFVASGLILTCAHVIIAAGGKPGGTVKIRFHTNGELRLARVSDEMWRAPDGDDVAVLELDGGLPASVAPFPLGDAGASTGHSFRAFGYPPLRGSEVEGLWATGKIEGLVRDSAGRQMLQLSSPNLAQGISGGPVLDEATGRVVGMVTAVYHPDSTTKHRDTGFATPAETLRAVCPALVESRVTALAVNPFEFGLPVPPDRFYGRRAQIADVKNRIGAITAQCVSIVGHRRSGKTSLLRYIKDRLTDFCPPEQKPLVVSLDLQDGRFHTPQGVTEGLRRGIERATGGSPWPGEANDDPYAVEDGLMAIRNSGRRLIILLDEFERIGARLEKFQDWGEDLRAKASAGLFALVIASKRPLEEIYTALNLTSPFGNIFSATILGALEESEWQRLVNNGFKESGRALPDTHLKLIDELAGGLPYYVQMAASLLWQHDDAARARDEFATQAAPRFKELWDDLTVLERHALRVAAGVSGLAAPSPVILAILRRHGLLRPDSRLFSTAFTDFVRSQS